MEKSKKRKKRTIKSTVGVMAKLGMELDEVLVLNIPLKLKYSLTKLAWSAKKYRNEYFEENDRLVIELGVMDEKTGTPVISRFIKNEETDTDVFNPNHLEYESKIELIRSKEVTFEMDEIHIEDFGNISSDKNFPALFSLID